MLTEQQAADLEQLAAFIDGRLSGEQKARVEERLLRDEDYYEVFLETVRFQEEQEAAGEGVVGRVVWWRSWRVAVPLVAAAALVVVVVGLMMPGEQPLPGDRVALLDPSAIVAREGWDYPGWRRFRSDSIPEGLRPEELAFRLGIRAVDLRVALAAGDLEAARGHVAQLEELAEKSSLFSVAVAYRNLGKQLGTLDPEGFAAEVVRIERRMFGIFEEETLEANRLVLGAWSEAGRLAAFSHDASALARVVRDDPGIDPVDEIATEMETLETILERPEPGVEDFDDAVAAFQEIVTALAG